jgi:hypothetical protein
MAKPSSAIIVYFLELFEKNDILKFGFSDAALSVSCLLPKISLIDSLISDFLFFAGSKLRKS